MRNFTGDPCELERFINAQRGTYEVALEELRRGEKQSHWMWFIFPQVAGLGTSHMAERYAIRSRQEAKTYLNHPILGARLLECTAALLAIEGKTVEQVMGYPDYLKLKSSMTLFNAVADPGSPFQAVLDRYYSGQPEVRTLEFLSRPEPE